MKNTVFNFASWMLSDPHRAFVILSVIVLVLALALAVPNGAALAEDIVGGS